MKFKVLINKCERFVERNEKLHIVNLKNKKIKCDCKDDFYVGIPCRHILAVVSKEKGLDYSTLLFNDRWKLNFHIEEEISQDPDQAGEIPQEVIFLSLNLTIKVRNPKKVKGPGRPVKNQKNFDKTPNKLKKARKALKDDKKANNDTIMIREQKTERKQPEKNNKRKREPSQTQRNYKNMKLNSSET